MKISKITIKDFRAFAHETEFDLQGGKNLLLYGENGSGKSSLFHALREFFGAGPEPRKAYADFRNIFASGTNGAPTATDGFVSLKLVDGSPPVPVADPVRTWTHGGHRPQDNTALVALSREQMSEARERAAFLDYRSLLKTNYHGRAPTEEFFELCVNVLLADVRVSPPGGTTTTVGRLWQAVLDARPERYERYDKGRMDRALIAFNSAVKGVLPSIQTHLHDFLKFFDHAGVTVDLDLPGVAYEDRSSYHASKKLTNMEFTFKVSLNGVELGTWKDFLNEARLSALALSLFLAAVKQRNPTPTRPVPRLLVLDDVLIGLDLSNRLPVLRILEQHFSDHQIFLLTHDKVWFDMASLAFADREAWIRYELHRGRHADCDIPVVHGRGSNTAKNFIDRARHFLTSGAVDLRAAALYARVALEVKLKSYCDDKSIPTPYSVDGRSLDTDDLWTAVESWLRARGKMGKAAFLMQEVKLFRRGVLNPMAHYHPVSLDPAEVEGAIKAVENLAFDPGTLDYLAKSTTLLAKATMLDQDRLDAVCHLRSAFEVDLRDLLERRGGKVPFRSNWSTLALAELWDSAKAIINPTNAVPPPPLIADIESERTIFLDDLDYGTAKTFTQAALQTAMGKLRDAASPQPKSRIATFP